MLVTVSAFVASAPLNFIAHVGVPIVSEEVNAKVIVSPSMLRSLSALLEFSVTEVSVGAVRSAVHEKVFDAALPLVTESVNAPAELGRRPLHFQLQCMLLNTMIQSQRMSLANNQKELCRQQRN